MTTEPNTTDQDTSRADSTVDPAAFHTIIQQLEDAIFILDKKWCFRFLNHQAERLLERTEAELLEKCIWDEFPEAVDSLFQSEYQRSAEAMEPIQFEEYSEPLDKWFHVYAYPFDSMFVVHFRDITKRVELESRRETFVRLFILFQHVSKSLVQQSSRADIEQSVCDHLIADDSYTAAWIGNIDWRQNKLTIHASAGELREEEMVRSLRDDNIFDDIIEQAVQTHDVEIHHLPSDTTFGEEDGLHRTVNRNTVVAVVPLVSETALYGVLVLYANGSNSFTDYETTVLHQLGELIGYSLAALERKSALMNDDIVELDFHITDLTTTLDTRIAGRITFDRIIPVGQDDFAVFGTVSASAIEALEKFPDEFPHFGTVSILSPETDPSRFELSISEPPVASIVAANGGRIHSARIEDEQYQMTVELPHSVDIPRVVKAVQDQYPEADVIAQRQTVRSDSLPGEKERAYVDMLTDRQSEVLEAAYAAGFFEWPRDSTGEEIADALGIQPPTFHKHIRKVEQTIFDHLLDDGESQWSD